jgi:uncharacterized protein YgiB involved in biofilm formation
MVMQQKRSRTIDLSRMLKQTLFPASALAAAFMLGGCGANEEEGYYFTSVEACEAAYPDKPDICTAAYQDAEQAAVESGPRYDTAKLCESEFSGSGWSSRSNAGSCRRLRINST